MTVCGRTPPSRWSFSSTFGAAAMSGRSSIRMTRAARRRSRQPRSGDPVDDQLRRSPAAARSDTALKSGQRRSKRSGVSVCSVNSGSPARTSSPAACILDPRTRLDRVFLAGPPGTQPPRGDANGIRIEGGEHAVGRSVDDVGRGPPGEWRPDRRPARRSSRAPGIHRPAVGQRRAHVLAAAPAASSISSTRRTVSSTTSAGPPPASTSTDSRTSRALPRSGPRGGHIRQQGQRF